MKKGDIKSDLQFFTGDGDYWNAFSKKDKLARGTVGVHVADRAPDWDRFVVVDQKDDETFDIIFPSILLKDGEIKLGKDKYAEDEELTDTCTCPTSQQGDDFYCRCGAETRQKRKFTEAFEEVDDDYEYEIVSVKRPKSYVWWGAVEKEECATDEPFRGGYCGCSKNK